MNYGRYKFKSRKGGPFNPTEHFVRKFVHRKQHLVRPEGAVSGSYYGYAGSTASLL